VDSDVIDLDATLGEQFLNVAVRQPEAQVPADPEDDDVWWEAKAREGGPHCGSRTRAVGSHVGSLAVRTRSQRTQQRLFASLDRSETRSALLKVSVYRPSDTNHSDTSASPQPWRCEQRR